MTEIGRLKNERDYWKERVARYTTSAASVGVAFASDGTADNLEAGRLKADCARMGSLIQDFADRIGVPVADVVAGFDGLLRRHAETINRQSEIHDAGFWRSFNRIGVAAGLPEGSTGEDIIAKIDALKAELAEVVSIIRPRVPSAWLETTAVRCAQEAMRSLDILNAALCDCVRKNGARNSAEDRQIETQAVKNKGDTA